MTGVWVHVCVWEPQHTFKRIQAQQEAVRRGVIAELVDKHGKGPELRKAMERAKLVTMQRSAEGDLECIECGALMEKLISSPGIVSKIEAARDIADNFDLAIERTREARE